MARLKTIVPALGGITSGHDWDATTAGGTGGTVTIDTTIKRNGQRSLKITSAVDASNYIDYQYKSADAVSFISIFVYFTAFPTDAESAILEAINNAGTTITCIGITTAGKLRLHNGNSAGAQLGSDSSVLSLNTWYEVTLQVNNASSPKAIAQMAVDGSTPSTFASGSYTTATNCNAFNLGFTDFVTAGVAYFSDIRVNDNSGSNETALPTAGEKTISLRPNAAGSVNTFATQTGGTAGAANNFTRVNESTPNDATSFDGSSTLNEEDMFAMDDSGMGASDTVKVVEMHLRFRNSTADATAKITASIVKTSGGTKSSSGTITPNSTTFRTNVPGTTLPKIAPIVTYADPDAAAWTQTTVDSMQAGYKLTTAPGTAGRRIDVTAVWVIVSYVPATNTTTNQTITGKARIQQSVNQTITGKARVTAVTTQTITGKARIRQSVSQTITGLSRITATVARTITGVARITKTTVQTITGVSRIRQSVTQTITGKSRIQQSVNQTITGVARIRQTVNQTITGIARIRQTVTQTITGKGFIQTAVNQTITGISRIRQSVSQTITGKSRIQETTTQTITGKGRIQQTLSQIITGKSRVQQSVSQTITGKSRLQQSVAQIITGVSRIRQTVVQTITGKSRITGTVAQTITGKARVTKTTVQVITGVSRVQLTTTQTITGKARIVAPVVSGLGSTNTVLQQQREAALMMILDYKDVMRQKDTKTFLKPRENTTVLRMRPN